MAEAKFPSDPVAEQLREQFPSNSKTTPAQKPERKPLEPVANGIVGKRDAKTLGKRFLSLFIAEDIKDIKRYILEDVLIPGIKTTILSSLKRLFFARGSSYYGPYRPYDYTKPGSRQSAYYYGGQQRQPPQPQKPSTPRTPSGLKFITYSSRQEADEVLAQLNSQIYSYGAVTVREYYEVSGVDSDHTDENWGWTTLAGAHCYPVHGGYALELPPVKVLE